MRARAIVSMLKSRWVIEDDVAVQCSRACPEPPRISITPAQVQRVIVNKKRQQVISASPGDALGSVIDRMKTHSISQLPIVEPGKLLGLVSEVKALTG
jgi:CBS domain-containing protein